MKNVLCFFLVLPFLLTACGQSGDYQYLVHIRKTSSRDLSVNFRVGDSPVYVEDSQLNPVYEGLFYSDDSNLTLQMSGSNRVESATVMADYDATGTATLDSRNSDGTSVITISVAHDAAYDAILQSLGYLLVEDASGRTFVVRTLNKTSGISIIRDPGGFFTAGNCRLVGIDSYSLTTTRTSHSDNRTVLTVTSSEGLSIGSSIYCGDFPSITAGAGPGYTVQMPDTSAVGVDNINGETGLSVGDQLHNNQNWFEISRINSPTEIEIIDPDGIWDYNSDGIGDGTFFDNIIGGNSTFLEYEYYRNGTLVDSGAIDATTGTGADNLIYFQN